MEQQDKILYDHHGIKIVQVQSPEGHDLYVGDAHCYLCRGMLREFAESDSEGLVQKLQNVHPLFIGQIRNYSVENVGWALAQARIRELDDEVSYFVSESQEKENQLSELKDRLTQR